MTASADDGRGASTHEAPTRIGRYVLDGPLGRGGMGVVYLARDELLGRRVAIKLLDSDAAPATRQARLLQEAQALARLAHPYVVTVHEAGSHAGRIFLAMEFVPGDTLRAWLRERPRERGELLAVAVQAGRGLAAAHDVGLVHRDVKPENIMVGADGRVRVMDFGLARLARTRADDEPGSPGSPGSLTQVGAMIGTPGYMAPEQRHGALVDERGDIYSFCVVLHELLAGERLGDEEPQAVLLRRGVPAWLAAVVAVGGILALPDPDAPAATIFRTGATWSIDQAGEVGRITDGELVQIGATTFRLHLPEALPPTANAASAAPQLDELRLRFSVSRDEEYVELVAVHGEREFDLQARRHHYVLLLLARARQRQSGRPLAGQGWVHQHVLLEQLRVDRNQLFLDIFRARRQLGEVGVTDAARIVERSRRAARGDAVQEHRQGLVP